MNNLDLSSKRQDADQSFDRTSILNSLKTPIYLPKCVNLNLNNKTDKATNHLHSDANKSKITKTEEFKSFQSPKGSENSDLYAVRLLEKFLKTKDDYKERDRAPIKRDANLKSRSILGERDMNVDQNESLLNKSAEVEDRSIGGNKQAQWPKKIRITSQRAEDENNPPLAPKSIPSAVTKNDPLADIMNRKKMQKYNILQLLYISASQMDFGSKMPGQIIDDSLEILNKSGQTLIIQITLDCERAEFRETEEYVYSIRRSHLFDFNDKHYLMMAPYSTASFKVTLKAPNVAKTTLNNGSITISVQGVKEVYQIALTSEIFVPKVVCPKALYHSYSGCSIIKLAVKEGRKNEYKIPIQNQSEKLVTLDFLFHRPSNADEEDELDLTMHPGTLVMGPAETGFVVFSIRINRISDYQLSPRKKVISKKILLAKVRNTNLIYSFPVCLETY